MSLKQLRPDGPIFFNFMQFPEKLPKQEVGTLTFGVGAHRMENPGSATDILQKFY